MPEKIYTFIREKKKVNDKRHSWIVWEMQRFQFTLQISNNMIKVIWFQTQHLRD